ncbi:VOC family protein [Ammoniphilus sp. YIM 78166]|uniref:VOC family protein n=1 Tax=Ammoniphilus sp. YIM 78166 TaxID=1644106 RepID=UPI0014319D46|nr:VOC family protein [Ammoniphilus sp. YIM 78166]
MKNFILDHVHIYTEDVEGTIQFYKQVFKAKELRKIQLEDLQLVHLKVGENRLVVSNSSEKNPVGLGHFAFAVDNLEEVMTYLSEKNNIKITQRGQAGEYTNVFIKDPNGVVIEILSPSTR